MMQFFRKLIALFLPHITRRADPGWSINVTVEESRMTQWCWAAATVGIAKYYQDVGEPRQCDVANRVLKNKFQCCPTNPGCNEPQDFAVALNRHLDREEHDRTKRTLAFVKAQIDRPLEKPVAIRMAVGTDGHIIVVSKYWVDDYGDEWFEIWDPESQFRPTTVSPGWLLTGYGGRTWKSSYITK